MMCEECKKRPATVHVTKMMNNKKYEKNLCQQCASESGDMDAFHEPKYSIHNLLAGLLNFEPYGGPFAKKQSGAMPTCENCGLSYAEFSRGGRLGCPMCYTHFSQHMEPLLKRIQGGVRHGGKIPSRIGGTIMVKSKLQQLRQELQKFIAREEFEKAAKIRDQIKEVEKELENKGAE